MFTGIAGTVECRSISVSSTTNPLQVPDDGFSRAVASAELTKAEAYRAHLREKYGPHFRVESVPRDSETLERMGGRMSGDDVIISPVILEKMIQDPETAAYYERTIDHCFETVPQDKAFFASMGLTFEPCGVIVHDDGTVTYICGGGDSPERVAEVNAENAARDAARAAKRRQYFLQSRLHAEQTRARFEEYAHVQASALLTSTNLKISLLPSRTIGG